MKRWGAGSPGALGRRLTVLSLTAVALLAWLHSARYADAFIDDAFITFRHAMNLLRGDGFTCNAGDRVEGTSSFLMAMLSAIPILFHADPLDFARALGRLSFVGCTIAAYSAVRACIVEPLGRLLGLCAALFTAATASLAFHSQTGLETLLFAFLIAVSLALYLRRFVAGKSAFPPAWALVAGVASLTRPEGPVFFCFLLGASLVQKRGRDYRAVLRDLLFFCAVFGPVLLFRRWYFEAWLPNSVLAKSGTSFTLRGFHSAVLLQALGYGATQQYHGFLTAQAAAFGLTLSTVLLKSTRFAGAIILGIIGICVAVVMWNGMGSDWMPYQRLMTPAVVPVAVGMMLGLRALLFHEAQGRVASLAVAVVIVSSTVVFNARALRVDVSPIIYDEVRALGKRLSELRAPGDLVASDIGGVLPYYWGIDFVDIFGLCDTHLAREGELFPGIGRSQVSYIASFRPSFLVFTYPVGAASFFNNPDFATIRDEYYLLKWPWRQYRRQFSPVTILVRKDRPGVDRFAAKLHSTLVEPNDEFRRSGFLRHRGRPSSEGARSSPVRNKGPGLFWNGAF